MLHNKFSQGYRRFQQRFQDERALFSALVQHGQHPQAIWIGCSDSRIIPEQLVDAAPGDLFTVRNVANIVPPDGVDAGGLGAVLEYGLLHLHIEHIIICGHTNCGGIKALEGALNPDEETLIARWLEFARPARSQVLKSNIPLEQQYLETIKANVLLQTSNLSTYACVQKALQSGHIYLHSWLYSMEDGAILAYQPETAQWEPFVHPNTRLA